ncbi:hypothetical protein LY76DRAFT_332417 [Colletotrichum caudatum]|nr:hypothetical protein LY76DRAFT_332417 [Colletotrichum caudatum]
MVSVDRRQPSQPHTLSLAVGLIHLSAWLHGKQVHYLYCLQCHPPLERGRLPAVSTERRSNRSWPDVIQLGISRRGRDSTRPFYHDHYSPPTETYLPTYLPGRVVVAARER